MGKTEMFEKQPRRTFFARLFSGMAGAAALLLAPRRARAEAKESEIESGPILYRRTEESERYYRTLYR